VLATTNVRKKGHAPFWLKAVSRVNLPPRHAAAVLSAYAAILHNWVLPDHWRIWWGYGLYFLLSACAQFGFSGALVLWPRARWFIPVGIAGNAAMLGLYAITRTIGIPIFGPAAGQVESVGWFDVLTAATEIALIVVLVGLLRASAKPRRSGPIQR
jgi:hypothetical protein